MATNSGQFNGNPALLISAPILQNYLVDDATGLPLANGTVSFYQDNSRTTFKNVYYQTGSPGNYTYFTLPNPLTLSSVGTIVDVNGNDTLPFYYPVSEVDNSTPQPYYVVVVNSNGQNEFTRQNFPFVSPSSSPTNTVPTNTNLIINNVFWRNIGSLTLPTQTSSYSSIVINGVTLYYKTVAPSQHDGYIMPDIIYVKDHVNATETITFNKFSSDGTNGLTNNVTPEYYFNLNTTGAGSETVKYLQFPIQLHILNLSGYSQASANVWVQNVGGNSNNLVTLTIYQFAGTGGITPIAVASRTITASSVWTNYTVNFTFPLASSVVTGNGGDDAWFLQIGFEAGVTTNINIAKPGVWLSQTQPTNDFQNYDVVESVINSPRTGDIRTSLNSFVPYGWVSMNDGSIGSASSAATSRANIDTWPLFNLIWNLFSVYTTSTTNLLAQMQNSAGTNVAYGASAYADFNANNRIALTKAMGKVLLGTAPVSSLLPSYTTTFTGSSSGGLLLTTANTVNYFNGMPIYFSNTGGALPTGLSANTIYYVANFNGTTTFNVATTFANAMAGTVISYTNNGTGTNTVTAALAGTIEGEYGHLLLINELPDPLTTTTANFDQYQGSSTTHGYINTGIGTYGTGVITNQGGNQLHNNTQPGTFYNMFMKL